MTPRFIFAAALSFTPMLSYAFFCPTNFNQIELGYSVEQVTSACGAPTSTQSTDQTDDGPQEWNYFMQQPSDNYMGSIQGPYNTNVNNQAGTIKTQITFNANGKVININVNGVTAPNTTMCSSPIQLGDDKSKIKAVCGQPTMINKPTPDSNNPPKSKKIETLTYMGNQTIKLIFEDGKLVRRE